jgi:hypothetical protein
MRSHPYAALIAWWNAYWFPKTSMVYLAVCRIVVVAAQLFWFSPSLELHLNLLEKNADFLEPQLLIVVLTKIVEREVFFTPAGFTLLSWINIFAGITALLGWCTRTSVFLFALVNWIFVAHKYSYANHHHHEALLAIFLMLLAFSPAGRRLSIDALMRRQRHDSANTSEQTVGTGDMAIWPLKLIHVLLTFTYFSTGLAKIAYGGLAWMNGYTLQHYMFNRAVQWDLPVGLWVAQQYTLCVFLSVFTIFFELFFWVSLFIPWTAPYFFLSGILFHIGLCVTTGHMFYQHMILLLLLLAFVSLERWKTRWNKGKCLGRRGGAKQFTARVSNL